MEQEKFNWKRLLITLGIVLITAIAVGGSVYYVMNEQIKEGDNFDNEGAYCFSLRTQLDIADSYDCSEGKTFEKDGESFIYISISRPNDKIVDHASFTMNIRTKEIISEAWAI